jgi:hypothetical protein
VQSSVVFTEPELASATFGTETVTVRQYWGEGLYPEQWMTDYQLGKQEFLTMWLSQKLRPWSYGGNPPAPSGLAEVNSLASDFSVWLTHNQQWFQGGGQTAKDETAKVQGLLTKATSVGFSETLGFVQELTAFINSICGNS